MDDRIQEGCIAVVSPTLRDHLAGSIHRSDLERHIGKEVRVITLFESNCRSGPKPFARVQALDDDGGRSQPISMPRQFLNVKD